MNVRTQIVLWVSGIILLFGFIFLVWAVDTNRISIFAENEGSSIQTVKDLKSLPSPDDSTFSRIFTKILNLVSK